MAAVRPFAGSRALAAAGGCAPPAPAPPPLAALLLPSSSSTSPVAAFASSSGRSGGDGSKRRKDGERRGGGGGGTNNSSSSNSGRGAAASPQPPPSASGPPAPPPPPPEMGWMWSGSGSGGRASATKQSLKSAGLRAKKSLGQNFLTDEATLERIVRASGVQPGDRVLEVGPGTGNLTRHLIAAGARVTAVEKDDALAARLMEAAPGLEALVHGDVLRVGLGSVVARMLGVAGAGKEEGESENESSSNSNSSSDISGGSRTRSSSPPSPSSVKIVANLPYNITKEFLLAALPLGGDISPDAKSNPTTPTPTPNSGVSEVTLMLEEDAARRLADPRPGRPDYRAMSVLVHRWSRPQYLFRIPKDRYFPQPGVDGAMVKFRLVAPADRPALPFPEPGPAAERAHAALINAAFSERRKMMRNVLTSGLGRGGRDWGTPTRDPAVVAEALKEIGARDEARPQELSPAQFAAFHCALARRAAEAAAVAAAEGGGLGGDDGDDEDDDQEGVTARRK